MYARCTRNMQDITNFGKNDCFSLRSLLLRSFINERVIRVGGELICFHPDKFMRILVRLSFKGGDVWAFKKFFNHS